MSMVSVEAETKTKTKKNIKMLSKWTGQLEVCSYVCMIISGKLTTVKK